MTLEWILREIKGAEAAPNSARAVYDLAALLIVRDHLRGASASTRNAELKSAAAPTRNAEIKSAAAPTLDQIEAALATITVSTEDERRRADDAKLWARTLGGK